MVLRSIVVCDSYMSVPLVLPKHNKLCKNIPALNSIAWSGRLESMVAFSHHLSEVNPVADAKELGAVDLYL